MSYWVLDSIMYEDSVFLSVVPPNGPECYKYSDGVTLAKEHPKIDDAIMCFDSNYPDRTKLYDFLPNIDSLIIVHSKVKNIFERLNVNNIEYLQVRLWNHNRQPVSDEYYIVNPLGSINFIDMDKSEYRMGALVKTQIKRIKNLVVNSNVIPDDAKIFRASTKLDQIFINEDVRKALVDEEISGFKVFQAEGWDGLGI